MKTTNTGITAIIPAYNEEKKIGGLLAAIHGSPYLNEIICINDGSSDNTLNIIRSYKDLRCINLKKNHGKAFAIAKGIKKATYPIVVFFDADLEGVTEQTIKRLVFPLVRGTYDASIGYVDTRNSDKFFKSLSGERAYFKKDLLPYLNEIEQKGYGLELYLNYLYHRKKVKIFPLRNVHHILKHEKQPYDTVVRLALVESLDIISELLRQDDPLSYFKDAYLTSFYLGTSQKANFQMLFQRLKRSLLTKLKQSLNA